MFKAFTVSYDGLPSDVDHEAFKLEDHLNVDSPLNYFLIVQMDGKTIFCRPESQRSYGLSRLMDLMELAYYLGVSDGVWIEQRFMDGRTLS